MAKNMLSMTSQRLEAFSDAVIAIIITIMVLELKIPHGTDWYSLKAIIPKVMVYMMSFSYLAIYWNNHHHMLHLVSKVNGSILWANMHLLFWLSLIPFSTTWMGEANFAAFPTAIYGLVLLLASISYFILQGAIIKYQGSNSSLRKAVGKDIKGKFSVIAYTLALMTAFFKSWISLSIFILVAVVWIVPDRRIERKLEDKM